jgi:hypothetical protein
VLQVKFQKSVEGNISEVLRVIFENGVLELIFEKEKLEVIYEDSFASIFSKERAAIEI